MPDSPGALTCSNERRFSAALDSDRRGDEVEEEQRGRQEPSMAESQLSELQNMRVLLEEANLLTRNLAYHRRAKLEARLELLLYELERQIEELRADRG
jgi:hypothetical protein